MKCVGVLQNKRTRRGQKKYIRVFEGKIKVRDNHWCALADPDESTTCVLTGKKRPSPVYYKETGLISLLQGICDGRLTVDDDGCICGLFFFDSAGGGALTIAPAPKNEEVLSVDEVNKEQIWR